MSILFFCDIINRVILVKKDELKEILEHNPELNKYMNEYLNAEYNTSKNTRESYATDLYLLAKYYATKSILQTMSAKFQY